MTQRPFAVFDIDGTLIRWQLFHAIVDQLGKLDLLSPEAYQQIRDARMAWKRREGKSAFHDYEQRLIRAYDSAVTDLKVDSLNEAVKQVFNEYKDQVYRFTRDLLVDLRSKNYLIFAISGSQIEVVKLLANYYGFDDFAGSIYEQQGDQFSGKQHILLKEHKVVALHSLIRKHNAKIEGSLAIGDSEGDIPVMTFVESAIAFNPTQKLYEEALRRHWRIVVERKDVTYSMNYRNDHYELEG